MTICGLFSIATPCPFCIFLVGFGMYFIHTVKANAHVLPRIDEMNKLFYRAIKLPNNYCTANIIPRVILPCMTEVAAKTVIRIFFTSFMVMLPACCTCCRFKA